MSETATLPGKEQCPGNLEWSAFGATYMDTVCASALEWPDGHKERGLCDADNDFRPGDVPCPFCDPDLFIDYQWAVRDGEHVILWEFDEQASLVRRARRHATAQGWPPPLAWDDDDIDNPDASPANWKEAA